MALERWGKRVILRAISAMMGDSAQGERPDWRARPHRVLFLRHDRIGDMILSTGILRAIAEAHPTLQLDVLASPANAPVLRAEPYVHEVIVVPRKRPLRALGALRRLRRRRYDAVIDCMVTAPSLTTLLLMFASGARYRIGVAQRGNGFAYTLPVPARESAEHIVDQLGALLTAFGLEPSGMDLRPRIRLTQAELENAEHSWTGATTHRERTGPRLLVNVSAGRADRAWPIDRFVHVIETARGHASRAQVLVIGAPDDKTRAVEVASRGGARLVQDQGLREALALVARADVVFTPNTSIAHAATAFGRPAVVLHPSGLSRIWGPYDTDGRSIESPTDTLEPISAEHAARAVSQLLDAAGLPPRSPTAFA